MRFILVPEDAAFVFGISEPPGPSDLHWVIALRDLWLGLLLMGLAALREWRSVALWLGLGALVCFGDAWIAWRSSGQELSVAFHIGSGLFCAGLGGAAWRHSRQG